MDKTSVYGMHVVLVHSAPPTQDDEIQAYGPFKTLDDAEQWGIQHGPPDTQARLWWESVKLLAP